MTHEDTATELVRRRGDGRHPATSPGGPTPTPLDAIYRLASHSALLPYLTEADQEALAVVRRLVEAAVDSADHDSVINHRTLKAAVAVYRAWTLDAGDGI